MVHLWGCASSKAILGDADLQVCCPCAFLLVNLKKWVPSLCKAELWRSKEQRPFE